MHGGNKTIKTNVVLIWNMSLKNFFKRKAICCSAKKDVMIMVILFWIRKCFSLKSLLFTHFEKVVCTRFQGKGDYMQLINTIICSLLFEQTECASKSSCKYTLFKNILFMKINVSSKKDNAILFAFIKVVVTFYLRLRNEFQPFPAKNQASDWLTQHVNGLEAWFLAENGQNSFLNLR